MNPQGQVCVVFSVTWKEWFCKMLEGDLIDSQILISFCEIPQLCGEEPHTFHSQAKLEESFNQPFAAHLGYVLWKNSNTNEIAKSVILNAQRYEFRNHLGREWELMPWGLQHCLLKQRKEENSWVGGIFLEMWGRKRQWESGCFCSAIKELCTDLPVGFHMH